MEFCILKCPARMQNYNLISRVDSPDSEECVTWSAASPAECQLRWSQERESLRGRKPHARGTTGSSIGSTQQGGKPADASAARAPDAGSGTVCVCYLVSVECQWSASGTGRWSA